MRITVCKYQHEAFIEKRHFRIDEFQNANVNGANRRTRHVYEKAQGGTK